MYPYVHDTGIALGNTHSLGNGAATLRVLDPEVANLGIGIRERQITRLGVRERRRVEVELHVVGLGPIDPALEVARLYLVTIYELITEVAIDLVQVQAVLTRNERSGLQHILTQLVDVAGTTRVVTRSLNTTRQGTGLGLEADYVVSLPAVQRERDFLQFLERSIRINADSGITLFGDLIRLLNQFCFHTVKRLLLVN